MTAITVDSHLIPYEMKGQGSPLLFIAGTGTNFTIWKPLAESLMAQHTTVAVNPQNLYRNDVAENDLYLKSLAESIQKFADELKLDSPCLIGHSSGAAIAAAIAYYFPEKVKKLVLINPFTKLDYVRFVFLATLEKLMATSLKEEEAIELLVPWLFSRVFLANTEVVHGFIASSKENFCLNGLEEMKSLIHFLPKIDISFILSKIKTPTLVLAGDQDLFVSAADRTAITDALPNAEVIIIPSAGHMAHWEQPDYCNKMISKFVTES